MNAPVPISDLFRVLLPRDHPNGWLAMITAYVDDSGTHGGSKIVLVAGLFGTEARLASLERNWRKHLERPLCGAKSRLKRFHMADCNASTREFTGWSRTETDYFCHQLQTEIVESGVSAYGAACSRNDWEELITGEQLALLGDPEGVCIWNSFVRMIAWAQANTFDPKMSFVFDSRPAASQRYAKVVFDAFQRQIENPALTGISFLSSYDIVLLQAADLLAWELYQHATNILLNGMRFPRRPQFRRLTSEMNFAAQIVTRDNMERMVAEHKKRDPALTRAMADHFTFFDPENPDYSSLVGKQTS